MTRPLGWLLLGWLLVAIAGGYLVWSPLGFMGWAKPHKLDPEDLPPRPRRRLALLLGWAVLVAATGLWLWLSQARA